MVKSSRGEKPSEHGAFCSGGKNGRAAAGEKLGSAGEKLGGEAPQTSETGKTMVCLDVWSTKRHEKKARAAAGEKIGCEVPQKNGHATAG